MKGKHLDEQIRKALEGLEVNFDPGSWNAFEERLDKVSSNEADPFDQLLTERLSGLEVPLQAGDWDAMEQRIEAEETAELIEQEAYIDNLAYEKLHRMEVPFQHSHWHLMAKRLEEEFSLRHKLYRYKVAEVALVALFLLTIIRFAPLAEGVLQRQQHDIRHEQPKILSPIPSGTKQVSPNVHDSQTLQVLPIAEASTKSNKNEPLSEKYRQWRKNNAAQLAGWPESIAFSNGSSTGLPPALSFLSNAEVNSIAKSLTLSEILAEQTFLTKTQRNSSVRPGENGTDFLASIQPGPVQSKFAWEIPQLPQQFFEKDNELRFSLFTATDLSYVFTPPSKLSVFDTLVPTNSDTTLASGYGGGILISWKKDRWEFQTGGVYSFKRYIPNTPVFLFETVNYYVREEFHGVQLDLLQVPLNIQYHFKNTGKWRFYGNGGISGHFITSSVYEITHERTPAFKLAAMPSPEGDVLEDNSTIRNEKEFPKGLFDGGNLRSNLYLTANIGFGVERFVAPRWSLFVQPNYQHYLMSEGIGTNKDKFYTLSFNLGTKVSLK